MFACSGPNVAATVAHYLWLCQLGTGILVVSFIVTTAFTLKIRQWGWAVVPLAMLIGLAAHPVWTFSAMGGDCGHFQANTSLGLAAVACYLMVLQGYFYLARERPTDAPVTMQE